MRTEERLYLSSFCSFHALARAGSSKGCTRTYARPRHVRSSRGHEISRAKGPIIERKRAGAAERPSRSTCLKRGKISLRQFVRSVLLVERAKSIPSVTKRLWGVNSQRTHLARGFYLAKGNNFRGNSRRIDKWDKAVLDAAAVPLWTTGTYGINGDQTRRIPTCPPWYNNGSARSSVSS